MPSLSSHNSIVSRGNRQSTLSRICAMLWNVSRHSTTNGPSSSTIKLTLKAISQNLRRRPRRRNRRMENTIILLIPTSPRHRLNTPRRNTLPRPTPLQTRFPAHALRFLQRITAGDSTSSCSRFRRAVGEGTLEVGAILFVLEGLLLGESVPRLLPGRGGMS